MGSLVRIDSGRDGSGTVEPSNHRTIEPSNHRTIEPSDRRTIESSDRRPTRLDTSLFVLRLATVRKWLP
ncbi:hypothetical protein A4G99_19865 [Haladaptatus sp. R4]|nr:hypothetical protein A4G99_19865 [Haladaptatus sp. R4]